MDSRTVILTLQPFMICQGPCAWPLTLGNGFCASDPILLPPVLGASSCWRFFQRIYCQHLLCVASSALALGWPEIRLLHCTGTLDTCTKYGIDFCSPISLPPPAAVTIILLRRASETCGIGQSKGIKWFRACRSR